ncbi:DUF5590 domain-containing protein [Bacillus sp. C11]|nr:DUF5590 domain-containing protein [Neobacillus terrae]NHM29155.1 DUF5590 domain-containing protein [Neobacillus terrae]
MKKWITIFIIVFVVLVGIMGTIYSTAMKPVKSAEEKAISIAEKKIKLDKVDHFHLYHGVETVYVLEGTDKKGQKVIVWVPEKSHDVVVRKAKNGLTRQEAIKKLLEKRTPEKIVSAKLGMENGIPFWEIYYLSDGDLINYYCVDFKTGEMVKRIENL